MAKDRQFRLRVSVSGLDYAWRLSITEEDRKENVLYAATDTVWHGIVLFWGIFFALPLGISLGLGGMVSQP